MSLAETPVIETYMVVNDTKKTGNFRKKETLRGGNHLTCKNVCLPVPRENLAPAY